MRERGSVDCTEGVSEKLNEQCASECQVSCVGCNKGVDDRVSG